MLRVTEDRLLVEPEFVAEPPGVEPDVELPLLDEHPAAMRPAAATTVAAARLRPNLLIISILRW
jgi:hypothetical protein